VIKYYLKNAGDVRPGTWEELEQDDNRQQNKENDFEDKTTFYHCFKTNN
jgi:hypothetical protein